MEYVLESGQWLEDIELYGGAPVLLFEHKDATPSINAWLLTRWHSMWIARARSLPIPRATQRIPFELIACVGYC
jgi:hypothetical protein